MCIPTVQGVLNPSTMLPLCCLPFIFQSNLLEAQHKVKRIQTTKNRPTFSAGTWDPAIFQEHMARESGSEEEPVIPCFRHHQARRAVTPQAVRALRGRRDEQPRGLGCGQGPAAPSASIRLHRARQRPSRPRGARTPSPGATRPQPGRRRPPFSRGAPVCSHPAAPQPCAPAQLRATKGLAAPPSFPPGACLGLRAPWHLPRDTWEASLGSPR